MKYILAIIILIFTTSLITQAQGPNDVPDDVDPGIFMFAMVFVGILAGAAAFGVIMTAITLLVIFAMVSFGILSASIIAGIYTRSVTKGFKVFFILCSIVLGGVFGCTGLYALNFFTHWHSVDDAILLGSAFGLVAGLAGGMISFYFLQRLIAWLRSKITIQTIPK